MNRIIKDLASGIVTLALIATAFVGAVHIQPMMDAVAEEKRQA
ncbi:hypothetical protein [Brevundimonas sp.]|nr:hypothetical protein [Brevundimonas sp.]